MISEIVIFLLVLWSHVISNIFIFFHIYFMHTSKIPLIANHLQPWIPIKEARYKIIQNDTFSWKK